MPPLRLARPSSTDRRVLASRWRAVLDDQADLCAVLGTVMAALTMTPIDGFRIALADAGLTAPDNILDDGRVHRVASDGRRGDTAGWYVLHSDGIAAGAFGNWRSGLSETWHADVGRDLTPDEKTALHMRVAEARRQADAERKTQQAEAAKRARRLWDRAIPVPHDHAYLVAKGVKPHGLRMHNGKLLVPLRDSAGTLHSLQFIAGDGEKKFLTGGRVRGCYHAIGQPSDTIIICEGIATGLSIHEATGRAVAAASSAVNLLAVAQALRRKYPDARLILCADDDYRTDGNPGLTKGTEAAQAVGALLAIPDFGSDRPQGATDMNDLHQAHGLDAVRECIEAARPVGEAPEPAVHDDAPEVTAADGATILSAVHDYLGRFVVYPSPHAHVAHTLWIAHAHLMDVWDSTPRLAFLSPEPGSGKSRCLEVTAHLVPRAIEAINTTPAYLFRKVGSDDGRPTILHDEIDTVFGPRAKENEDIRALINAGHRKHGVAGRCVVRGKQVFTEEIPAYCAVALAGLGDLPETIMSRAIVIRMRRRAPSETIEPYRERVHGPEAEAIGARLAAWAEAIAPTITTWPEMPEGIADRSADIWEALLAVADAAGGDWPQLARVAAVTLVTDSRQNAASLGVQLLADMRSVWPETESVSTEAILDRLHALEESPWADLRGKPLDARRLSRMLRRYGVAPKYVRIGATVSRGYSRTDFADAWTRYLSDSTLSQKSVTSVTPVTGAQTGRFGVTDISDVTHASVTNEPTVTEKPPIHAVVTDVTHVTDLRDDGDAEREGEA